MTMRLPPGVSLGDIPAGGVIADSVWPGDDIDNDNELDSQPGGASDAADAGPGESRP
jgi:hypothetical protein